MGMYITKNKKNYSFPGIGIITIPPGMEVRVTQKSEGVLYGYIVDKAWTNKFDDEIRYKMHQLISNELFLVDHSELQIVIRASFFGSDDKHTFDAFKSTKGGVYVRVFNRRVNAEISPSWYQIEADFEELGDPIPDHVTIQITDYAGNILVEEKNEKEGLFYYASQQFPFSWEEDKSELYRNIYNKPAYFAE